MHSARTNLQNTQNPNHPAAQCERCGSSFHCGISDDKACWCSTEYPAQVSGKLGGTCLCPACLKKLIEEVQIT